MSRMSYNICDICDEKYFKQKTWKIRQVEIESFSSEVVLIVLIQTKKKKSKRSLFNPLSANPIKW